MMSDRNIRNGFGENISFDLEHGNCQSEFCELV